MRIAFADLIFSWPPHGGADVDLYHTAGELQRAGHDVHLFVAGDETSWERGTFSPEAMPFPATLIPFTPANLKPATVGGAFRKAIDAYGPDVVMITDGFFLKPALILALEGYPLVSRHYAYEIVCMRDHTHFRKGAPCEKNFLKTPNFCRYCALGGMVIKDQIKRCQTLTWTEEYLVTNAYRGGYYKATHAALASLRAAVVYNERMADLLADYVPRVVVIPGGVNAAEYSYSPLPPKKDGERTIILMAGRAEDPLKGLGLLRRAGERLSRTRNDFEIWATHTDPTLNTPWFRAIGWHKPEELRRFYRDAHICVVPSVWEEPFGLVAVEAMAMGRPVIASRVGGLQTIVVHEETGLLFDRDNEGGLAACLARLLDDGALRERYGAAGRARVEEHYDWPRVIARHYPPLFEQVMA